MKRFIIISSILALFYNGAMASQKEKNHRFTAQSYIVADMNGEVLQEHRGDKVRSIASITKLMVGFIAVEQDLDEMLAIPAKRTVSSSIPRNVRELSRRDLIMLSMVKSDNFASQILCNNIPNCIDSMNERAASLGMENTKFAEPTGLSKDNVSTARDLLKLMMASAENSTLSALSSMTYATILTDKEDITVRNTNPFTRTLDVVLSKTGFTRPAGGCLVMITNSEAGKRVLILLGSKNVRARVPDMKQLLRQHGIYQPIYK